MADINGAASLKPAIGIFTSTGGTSEGGSAILIGSGHINAHSNEETNSESSLIGVGIYSSNASSLGNANISLIAIGIYSSTPTNTTDSNISLIGYADLILFGEATRSGVAVYLGCGALYAKPTLTTDEAGSSPGDIPIILTGRGLIESIDAKIIIGGPNIKNRELLIGYGKSIGECFIANIDDYYNELVDTINDTPSEPCYHVHVNRIIEENKCNSKLIMSKKCYPGDELYQPPLSNTITVGTSRCYSYFDEDRENIFTVEKDVPTPIVVADSANGGTTHTIKIKTILNSGESLYLYVGDNGMRDMSFYVFNLSSNHYILYSDDDEHVGLYSEGGGIKNISAIEQEVVFLIKRYSSCTTLNRQTINILLSNDRQFNNSQFNDNYIEFNETSSSGNLPTLNESCTGCH